MPVDTTTVTAGDIIDELDERLDEVAAEADAADTVEEEQDLNSLGLTLEQRLVAFEELAEEHGRDAEFVLAEMTADERMRFGDMLEAAREQAKQRRGFEAGSNQYEVFWTGAGVVDAPWLDGDEDMQERVAALRAEADWRVIQDLKQRVTEVNRKGNPERKSFVQRRGETATPPNEQS